MKAIYHTLFFIHLILSHSVCAKMCDLKSPVKSLRPRFAQNFSVDYFLKFKIVHSGKYSYVLSDGPLDCELDLIKVTTPVKHVAMTSTTYLPALELLSLAKALVAFQGKRYIVSKNFELKNIKEMAYKINPEEMLKLRPDLIMAYEANITSEKQNEVFKSLNLPVVMNYDFLEKSPLARAEWLLFISSFFNLEEKAQVIFNQIRANYQATKDKSAHLKMKPTVLIGDIQNGFWITSGALSDQGQMITDANAKLVIEKPSASMQKISLEELSKLNAQVDFWLTHNMWQDHNDLIRALKHEPRYLLIKAKNIYNNNNIQNAEHFNDFWEMGMQRPDLVLLDLSSLFHPQDFPQHKLKWYHKL